MPESHAHRCTRNHSPGTAPRRTGRHRGPGRGGEPAGDTDRRGGRTNGVVRVSPALARPLGRESEAAQVWELLASSQVVTLTGAPGAGKSRLARQVADQLNASAAPPRALVVNLEGVTDPDEVAPTVARSQSRQGRQPERGGHEGGVVVVLDDCDRVLAGCAEVAAGLVARGMRVLATSREPLRVEGEAVWRVAPLRVPPPGQDELLSVFDQSEAVQLFCERAASVESSFVLTRDNAPAVAQICRRLEGVPLAIELAARAISTYSPTDLVDRLDEPFSVLASGPRTAHPRHRDLWTAIAWSHDLLAVPERVLLERLAVFPGIFTDDALRQVCSYDELPDVRALLRSLVEKSLVEVETDGGRHRWRLLEMIRWFAAKRLAAVGEEEVVRDRHARWCASVVEAAGDPRQGRRWRSRVQPHHADVVAGLEWALQRADPETAVALAEGQAWLCGSEAGVAEARRRLERMVAIAAAARPGLKARALSLAGLADAVSGRLSVAAAHLEQSVAAAEEAGEAEEAAAAHGALAFVTVVHGQPAALAALEAAAADAREAREAAALVDALAALGRAHLLVGEPRSARQEFAESLALARAEGDEAGEAQALVGLGGASVALGSYDEADAALGQGLALARDLGERHAAEVAQAWLGESARLRGGPATELAYGWFSEAAELARSWEHPYPLGLALVGLGRIALDAGDVAAARASFEAALDVARRSSLPYLLAPSLCGLAELASDPIHARSLIAEALSVAQCCCDRAGEALTFEQLARQSSVEGDVRAATSCHRRALLLRARIGDPAAIATSLEALAALAAARGDWVVAARLVAAAEALRDRHGCLRPASGRDEHARIVESVGEALGEHAFAAECREGAAMSIRAAVSYAARHRGPRGERPKSGWAALTGGERNVALLVAQGLTNAEIARQFGIAPTTVKAHLRRVYAKLGITTRAALAAEVYWNSDK